MSFDISMTLSDVLSLVGRLDSSPEFDSARERFRRFLYHHVTDVRVVSAFIDQGQHAPGPQVHFALQDLITVLGRFLGFETAFGNYAPLRGNLKYDGHWNSRGRLHAVLEIRTGQTSEPTLDRLARSTAALRARAHVGDAGQAMGLCVLLPSYTGERDLDDFRKLDRPPIRIVSIGTLLVFAALAGSGRLAHEEFVRLLLSDVELDFVAELLDRVAPQPSSQPRLVERR